MNWKTQKLRTMARADVQAHLATPAWYMAEKYDGRGLFTEWDGEKITFYNLTAGEVEWKPGLREHFEAAIAEREAAGERVQPFLLQGEQLRPPGGAFADGDYQVFWTCHDLSAPFAGRVAEAAATPGVGTGPVNMTAWINDPAEKQRLYSSLYAEGHEGVVFARANGRYQPGKRVQEVLKHKWVEAADVAVTGVQLTSVDVNGYPHGSASIAIVERDGEGGLRWRPFGAVHVRRAELADLELWQRTNGHLPYPVLEIQYLYCTGDSLVQPVAKRVRFDKEEDGFQAYTEHSQLRVSRLFQEP